MPDQIPQLSHVSQFLLEKTGWTLRPVAGLLSPRDFLNALAFRVFHSTQYIRHHSKPFYTPEPDVIHDVMGHCPLLVNPIFADLSQAIGIASLGASDQDITRLGTLYWYTIEFGICCENGQQKAYGAGLLSSPGELQYCLSDKPKYIPYDPSCASEKKYIITEYQKNYFVTDSFEDFLVKTKHFLKTLEKTVVLKIIYDEETQAILVREEN